MSCDIVLIISMIVFLFGLAVGLFAPIIAAQVYRELTDEMCGDESDDANEKDVTKEVKDEAC